MKDLPKSVYLTREDFILRAPVGARRTFIPSVTAVRVTQRIYELNQMKQGLANATCHVAHAISQDLSAGIVA
jgi:hypothetical protein